MPTDLSFFLVLNANGCACSLTELRTNVDLHELNKLNKKFQWNFSKSLNNNLKNGIKSWISLCLFCTYLGWWRCCYHCKCCFFFLFKVHNFNRLRSKTKSRKIPIYSDHRAFESQLNEWKNFCECVAINISMEFFKIYRENSLFLKMHLDFVW